MRTRQSIITVVAQPNCRAQDLIIKAFLEISERSKLEEFLMEHDDAEIHFLTNGLPSTGDLKHDLDCLLLSCRARALYVDHIDELEMT